MCFQAYLDAVEKQTGKTPQQIVDWGSPACGGGHRRRHRPGHQGRRGGLLAEGDLRHRPRPRQRDQPPRKREVPQSFATDRGSATSTSARPGRTVTSRTPCAWTAWPTGSRHRHTIGA